MLLGSLWLRGRLVSDTFRVNGGAGITLHAFCGSGSVALAVTRGGEYFRKDPDGKTPGWAYSAARPPIDFHARWSNLGNETRFNRAGFVTLREPSRGTLFGVLAPCAPTAAGLAGGAVVRVAWFRLFTRRRRRLLAGLCPACGHDMRALVERCTHCGRPRARGGLRIDRGAESHRRAA